MPNFPINSLNFSSALFCTTLISLRTAISRTCSSLLPFDLRLDVLWTTSTDSTTMMALSSLILPNKRNTDSSKRLSASTKRSEKTLKLSRFSSLTSKTSSLQLNLPTKLIQRMSGLSSVSPNLTMQPFVNALMPSSRLKMLSTSRELLLLLKTKTTTRTLSLTSSWLELTKKNPLLIVNSFLLMLWELRDT